MSNALIPVNLGFAEFVSLLVREVFDAVVSSQLEQIVKIEEFHSLATSGTTGFAEQYVTQDEISAEGQVLFSADVLGPDIEYTVQTINAIVARIPEISSGMFVGGAMSSGAREAIVSFLTARIVERKKGIIQAAIVSGLIPKLQVDSGEITARVSFTVSQLETTPPVGTGQRAKLARGQRIIHATALPKLVGLKNLGTEFVEAQSNEKFILVDKAKLKANNDAMKDPLPNVRLTVRQADKAPLNANVFSEVTIKFKAI